jgi:hypothetical protein
MKKLKPHTVDWAQIDRFLASADKKLASANKILAFDEEAWKTSPDMLVVERVAPSMNRLALSSSGEHQGRQENSIIRTCARNVSWCWPIVSLL